MVHDDTEKVIINTINEIIKKVNELDTRMQKVEGRLEALSSNFYLSNQESAVTAKETPGQYHNKYFTFDYNF